MTYIIFGTGKYWENRAQYFDDKDIVCFIDNDPNKQGCFISGKKVESPEIVRSLQYDYVCIMVGTRFNKEVSSQLRGLGVNDSKIISFDDYLRLNGEVSASDISENFFFDVMTQPGLSLKQPFIKNVEWKPLVSIITPFYNGGAYFEETFNAIINQTFPWYEWIIINDGSTNHGDVEIVKELAKKDARIRVIDQENRGLAAARNQGYQESRAEVVVQVDQDDILSEQYVEYAYWGLFFNRDAAWAYTWSVGFLGKKFLWKKPFDFEMMKKQNSLVEMAAVRKSAWEKAGGYSVYPFSYYEDWMFWLKLMEKGLKPVCLGGYLSWYRWTETGMLAGLKSDSIRENRCMRIINAQVDKLGEPQIATIYPTSKRSSLYAKRATVQWDNQYKDERKKGKTILVILPWMVMGGADKFNYDSLLGLKAKGFNISIITLLPSSNEWAYKFKEITDDIFVLPNFLDTIHYLDFVEYYIQSRNVDAVMVSGTTVGYHMVPLLRLHFPSLPIFDYLHMEEWYWKGGGHARSSAVFKDFLDKTYVCNSNTERIMNEYFECDKNKVETLYIGVDEDKFNAEKVKDYYLHDLLSLDKSVKIVLFPCRIHPQKRPFMLLDIADKVRKENPNIVFVVVGDGPQLNELRAEIVKRGLNYTIKCIGSQNDMTLCYKAADITLICSLKEGISLTTYESCSMGTPVISSDVGGQKELVSDATGKLVKLRQSEEHDIDARVFPEEEVQEYVDAILEIVSDKDRYNVLSNNCRKMVTEKYKMSDMQDRFAQIVTDLCENSELQTIRETISSKYATMESMYYELYRESCIIDNLER